MPFPSITNDARRPTAANAAVEECKGAKGDSTGDECTRRGYRWLRRLKEENTTEAPRRGILHTGGHYGELVGSSTVELSLSFQSATLVER